MFHCIELGKRKKNETGLLHVDHIQLDDPLPLLIILRCFKTMCSHKSTKLILNVKVASNCCVVYIGTVPFPSFF